MDGPPVKGASIPFRLFLCYLNLSPTMMDVNRRFSVRYFVNLVLIDEDDRRYYKHQEITLYRKADEKRKGLVKVPPSAIEDQIKSPRQPPNGRSITPSITDNDSQSKPELDEKSDQNSPNNLNGKPSAISSREDNDDDSRGARSMLRYDRGARNSQQLDDDCNRLSGGTGGTCQQLDVDSSVVVNSCHDNNNHKNGHESSGPDVDNSSVDLLKD